MPFAIYPAAMAQSRCRLVSVEDAPYYGAYTCIGRRACFHRARRPGNGELSQLLDTLSRRVVRILEQQGLLIADPEHPRLEFEAGTSLDHLQAASISYRIAMGPQAGRKALTFCTWIPRQLACWISSAHGRK
jgi:hypothetical protein